MKTNYLLLLLFCASLTAYSQKLSIEDIINLKKLPIENVDQILTRKGFNFVGGYIGKNDGFYRFVFTNNAEEKIFITYWTKGGEPRLFEYQLKDRALFMKLAGSVTNYGYKKVDVVERIEVTEQQLVFKNASQETFFTFISVVNQQEVADKVIHQFSTK
jgi:hypothetical protein